MSSCGFQCDFQHRWIAQQQISPVSVYCVGAGCHVLCYGVTVNGQGNTATSRHLCDKTSDVKSDTKTWTKNKIYLGKNKEQWFQIKWTVLSEDTLSDNMRGRPWRDSCRRRGSSSRPPSWWRCPCHRDRDVPPARSSGCTHQTLSATTITRKCSIATEYHIRTCHFKDDKKF